MLASAGPCRNKIDVVKLLFLLGKENPELPKSSTYEFVPYHRGPYSFTLAYDLMALERAGMIVQGARDVSLTTLGRSEAEKASGTVWNAIDRIKREHGGKSTDDLICHVYGVYDFYTMNSKWIERRAVPRPKASTLVYTTGYEDVTLDGLLSRLIRSGIERLIDVRANPVARRFGFHKSTLARICPKLGIEYVHVPQVGVPSAWRDNLESQESYQALFARYAKEILPRNADALDIISAWVVEKPSALMCREADPTCCHRTTLAQAVSAKTALRIRDLGEEAFGDLF